MNCRDVDELLMSSGGDLVPADVAAHLRTCAACRELVSMTFVVDAVPILTADIDRACMYGKVNLATTGRNN